MKPMILKITKLTLCNPNMVRTGESRLSNCITLYICHVTEENPQEQCGCGLQPIGKKLDTKSSGMQLSRAQGSTRVRTSTTMMPTFLTGCLPGAAVSEAPYDESVRLHLRQHNKPSNATLHEQSHTYAARQCLPCQSRQALLPSWLPAACEQA